MTQSGEAVEPGPVDGAAASAIPAPGGRSLVGESLSTLALAAYSVTAAVSFAALVFAGPAAGGLARGAVTFVFASAVMTLYLAWRSRLAIAIASVQDTAAIVLVPAVATIATGSSDDPVRDLVVVVSLSTLLTGAVLWSIGRAHLASATRFVPTTVVAGFLAGTGWLLAKGGFDVMTGLSLTLDDVDDLVDPDLVKFWLPGAVLGVLIALVPLARRIPAAASSAATIAATIGFFCVVGVASSVDVAERDGWLVGPFPAGGRIDLVVDEFADADWSVVADTLGSVGVVVILSLMGALLNISGLQALQRRRIDMDVELRTTGVANLLVAPFGGLVGYHAIGDTSLAVRMGITRRWVPFAVGGLVLTFSIVGQDLIGYLPRFVAGGLLIGAGLGLLIDWVGDLRDTAGWSDRLVSVAILAVIVFVGILEGIVLGLVAACVFFVIRYSRIDPVRIVASGSDRRSVVGRSEAESAELDLLGPRMAVYELQGSLFFGSVTGVADRVRDRLISGAAGETPVEVVIMDFGRVADVDASAFSVLAELSRDVAGYGARFICSGLSAPESAALGRSSNGSVDEAHDLDAALETAEEELLARHGGGVLVDGDVAGQPPYSPALLEVFSRRVAESGDVLVTEGEVSDELFILTAGRANVSRRFADGRTVRLRVLLAGTTIGEIGFLTGEPRTATVVADGAVELLALDRATHDRLRLERPDLAMELYDNVLRSTAALAAAIDASLNQAMR